LIALTDKHAVHLARDKIELKEMEWAAFLVFSIGIILLSWRSFQDRSSHGFYRFFAFEAILALILLNLEFWFRQPFSIRQILSWSLLLISLFLAIHGFWLLRQIGKPDASIDDPRRLNIEKTTQLVKVGAYRYIRHPLYTSLLCLAWGAFLKHPSLVGAGLGIIATLALYATSRAEEAENLEHFGAEYAEYIEETKMFIPLIF
jgi:protein-S-isoprenylcysteine O-methyltransferase Ste14